MSEASFPSRAYAAGSPTSPLAPATIRAARAATPQDVQIEILYCGVCHSDLHQVRNEWRSSCPRSIPACPATRSSAA